RRLAEPETGSEHPARGVPEARARVEAADQGARGSWPGRRVPDVRAAARRRVPERADPPRRRAAHAGPGRQVAGPARDATRAAAGRADGGGERARRRAPRRRGLRAATRPLRAGRAGTLDARPGTATEDRAA